MQKGDKIKIYRRKWYLMIALLSLTVITGAFGTPITERDEIALYSGRIIVIGSTPHTEVALNDGKQTYILQNSELTNRLYRYHQQQWVTLRARYVGTSPLGDSILQVLEILNKENNALL